MFRKVIWSTTLIASTLAAFMFIIPTFFFLRSAQYQQAWLLYVGSFLFFIVIATHTLRDSRNRGFEESTVAMIFASHVATIIGVILACALCFLMMVMFIPGFLGAGEAEKTLVGEPAHSVDGKTDGLAFKVFMAAILFNFSMGSVAGIVLPFYSKRNQTRDSREPTPLKQTKVETERR